MYIGNIKLVYTLYIYFKIIVIIQLIKYPATFSDKIHISGTFPFKFFLKELYKKSAFNSITKYKFYLVKLINKNIIF